MKVLLVLLANKQGSVINTGFLIWLDTKFSVLGTFFVSASIDFELIVLIPFIYFIQSFIHS